MPAKGKHRRSKAQRLTRTIAVAGTGGAALALPLMGAAGAHAAPAHSVAGQSAHSAPATAAKAPAQGADQKQGTRTYTVRGGDYLSKIAAEQHVDGGWKRLYADNREAVGSDPSLIHPGLRLVLGGKAAPGADRSAPASGTPRAAAEKPAAAPKPAEREPAAQAPAAPKPAAPAAGEAASSGAASNVSPQSAGAQPVGSSSGYVSPVPGGTVGTPYRQAGGMWSSGYHTGTDFVVPTGTSLKAVGAGTVVSAGWGGAYGNQVVIRLADGHYAQYAHLSSLSVSAGQSVTAGQQVGLSGATGNVTGPHLHFEIRTTPDYGSDVDPIGYLRAHGVAI
ncbi:M23 family metallopeptidase [Streptomyces sp. SHP 1-2]|uniref:M23 family metallopeptidase n=1 Tax=Streptomyces sp. SHP 1-2 TaxID=2769489 RepID=UPI002237238B|nr:M23 family metallopeptidase [Streptomyces sp. SHP 1-2]MCW5252144.1 peptidoglycan DD-metalloendopeptidase family protein [Streptomyces sp. SHP 1-2]